MKKTLSIEDSPGLLVGQLASYLRLQVDRALSVEGVTGAQWTVLWMLNAGRAKTPAEISIYLSMDTGAVTRLLDRMVAKNLLVRKPHEKDRRRVILEMTPQAQELYPRLPAHVAEVVQHFFRDTPPEDLLVFKRVLLQAIHNGESYREDASKDPGSS